METIKKAIRQTFIESHGHTTIQNIADWLTAQNNDPRAKELALRLDSFAYGQYSKFFNDYANVNMSNDFVVLELDDLKSQRQLQQVVLLQLVAQITNEMYLTNGRRKLLVIDEGWELLDDPVMSRAMETAYRKARKVDGSIITVTQGISDLYKSRSGQSMIENATWQIILQQKIEAIDAVYNAGQLTLDPYSYKMLKTLNTVPGSHSEMMIVGDGCVGIFRLTVDKFTQVMYSTTGQERSRVLSDIDNGVDVIESIQSLMVGDESFARLGELRRLAEETLANGRNKDELRRMIIQSVNEIAKQHMPRHLN
jgi:conjugal transfer ATP-binding protein TraC